jgi:hypothetical protein
MRNTVVVVAALSLFAVAACSSKPAEPVAPPTPAPNPDVPRDPNPNAPLPEGHPAVNETGTGPLTTLPDGRPLNSLPAPPPGVDIGPAVRGSVAETVDTKEYTYVRVKTAQGEEWTAIPRTPTLAVGDEVVIGQSVVMEKFYSKSLNKTFDRLVMGVLVGAPKKKEG